MNNLPTLTTLVESALAAFPTLAYRDGGSRADEAARLIDEHKITYLGTQLGLDWWEVNQHRVSIKQGSCTCQDTAAPRDPKGRLCKHRLAAMFEFKLERAQMQRLTNIFVEAPGDVVTLKLDVFGRGNDLEYWLNGYHYPGRAWQTFSYDDRRQITEAMFNAAIRIGGFFLSGRPSKQPGYAHHYPLARIGSAIEVPVESLSLSDLTHENVNRFAQMDTDRAILDRIVQPAAPRNAKGGLGYDEIRRIENRVRYEMNHHNGR